MKYFYRKAISLLLSVLLAAGMAGCGNDSKRITGGADYSGAVESWAEQGGSAFDMTYNSAGMPVYRDPNAALKQAKKEFADVLALIQKKYDLEPISQDNYKPYKTHGWQVETDDQNLKRDGSNLTAFLDIYENSFERS